MKKRFNKKRVTLWKKYKKFQLHHKIFFSLVALFGAVLVWRGIWYSFESVPFLESPISQIVIGFILVAISGAFFKLL